MLTGLLTRWKVAMGVEMMMRVSIACLALVAVALAAVTPAAARTPSRLQVCLEKAGNTLETNACHSEELSLADKELARYAAAARKVLKDEKRKLESFEAGETAWASYRRAYCEAVYYRWAEGTIRTAMNLGCQADLTRAHTHAIWNDYLVTMAGETLLPEPR